MKKIHIDLQEGQKIFLTSDLHIGHKNVLRFCHRPFLDEKDMTKDLVANWNSVVGENDIVFDLGDMFWWNSRHEVKKVVTKLNGTIFKIQGNHDPDCEHLFSLCPPEKVIQCGDIAIVWVTGLYEGQTHPFEFIVSHFPLATWPHWGKGVPSFFGHIHSGPLCDNMVDIPGKDLFLKQHQYDVGVDNNNYTPISLEEACNKAQLVNFKSSLNL